MSSFSGVRAATCRIVAPDGSFRGTGFFVLPGGCLLTCHHVVFGLEALHVQLPGDPTLHPAEYLADFSNPAADIAVLRVPGLDVCPVQLGRLREGCEAMGYGFRPGALAAEKAGHSFSGKLGPGQDLQLAPPAELKTRLEQIAPAQRRPWNQLPGQFRLGQVRNFYAHGLLERGISGGPIYDPTLRRVVGLFRAIEGEDTAYVIPMDDVFASWEALESRNRNEVAEPLLDQLLVKHRLALVGEGARPIVPLAWDTFKRLFEEYSRFGGRSRESEVFSQFLQESDHGYCFVTGLAGFGKTALLIHWAQSLRQSSASPVIHFISPLVRDGTDEVCCLQNLCEQLLAIHGVGGDVPQDARRLRPLYADLLRLSSPRHRIVVVLDGLDEALGEWTSDAILFPQELGAGVYVVFSARQIADRDWLATLGLEPNAMQVLELGKLTIHDVTDVLVQTHLLPANAEPLPAVAERLLTLTDGDPFYLQDLVKDMTVKGANLDALQPYQVGHINYLTDWWKTAVRRRPDQSFIDLMGTLAALRAPLGRTELIRISDDDQLTGANIDVLLEDAARYIQGSKEAGYQLVHSRIRSFIQKTLDRDFTRYQQRVADFCLYWNRADATDLERLYVLRYAVPHLIEAGRTSDAIALLTPEWISEEWHRLGSYLSFIRDLDLLLETVAEEVDEPVALTQFPAVAVARQTAREIMASFPEPLLTALVRLGGIAHVTDLLRSLNEYRGQAAEPLVAVADELVSQDYLADPATNRVEACELASRLLERALGMLPLVRTSAWKLERLTQIAKLLRTAPFTGEQREPLIARMLSFAEGAEDLTLRMHALALMTQVLVVFPQHQSSAQELMQVVEAQAERLELLSDRLCVRAMLVPALRALEPGRLDEFVRSHLESITEPLSSGSLGDNPITDFLTYWEPPREGQAEWVAALLEKLVRLYLDPPEPERTPPAALFRTLLQLGQTDKALQLLGEVWDQDNMDGAHLFLGLADVLIEVAPEHMDRWLVRAQRCQDDALHRTPAEQSDFPVRLACVYGLRGRWDEALALLDQVNKPAKEPLIDCVRIAAAATPREEVRSRVARVVEKAEGLEQRDQAEVEAAAARALATTDRGEARHYLERAIRRCLTEFPEGDADRLRLLQALVLAQHGDIDAADQAARKCHWQFRQVATHVALLKAVPRDQPEQLQRFAQAILTEVNAIREEDTMAGAILTSACEAASYLAPLDPRLSGALCDGVCRQVARLARDYAISCTAAQVQARAQFDRDTARQQWLQFADWYAPAFEPNDVKGFFKALESLAGVFPDTVAQQLQEYRDLLDAISKTEDRFAAESAYICALAAVDRPQALAQVENLVNSLHTLEPSPTGIHHFRRLFEELTGRWAGDFSMRPEFVEQAACAVVAAAQADTARATALLDKVFAYGMDAENPGVRAKSVAAFFRCLAQAPDELQAPLSAMCDAAVERVMQRFEAAAADELWLEVIESWTAADRFDTAERLSRRVQGADARARAEEEIDNARANARLDVSKPFAAAYVDTPDRTRGLAFAVLRTIQLEGKAREVLNVALRALANRGSVATRSRLLDKLVPTLVLPFMEIGGPAAVNEVVAAIEDFDDRLIRAAALIAASA